MDNEARQILIRHGFALRQDQIVDPREFSVADLNLDYLIGAWRAFTGWLRNRA
jgi:hypothetical protein